jgi:hypothetical protein
MQATYVGTAAADFVKREAERHVRTAQKVTHRPRQTANSVSTQSSAGILGSFVGVCAMLHCGFIICRCMCAVLCCGCTSTACDLV